MRYLIAIVVGLLLARGAWAQMPVPTAQPLKGARSIEVSVFVAPGLDPPCELNVVVLKTSALFVLQQTRLKITEQPSDLFMSIFIQSVASDIGSGEHTNIVGCFATRMLNVSTVVSGKTSYATSTYRADVFTSARIFGGPKGGFFKQVNDELEEAVKDFAVTWGQQNP